MNALFVLKANILRMDPQVAVGVLMDTILVVILKPAQFVLLERLDMFLLVTIVRIVLKGHILVQEKRFATHVVLGTILKKVGAIAHYVLLVCIVLMDTHLKSVLKVAIQCLDRRLVHHALLDFGVHIRRWI